MKTALLILPANLCGGAEGVMHTVARQLAQSADWRVSVFVLASEQQAFYDFNQNENISIKYGNGDGKLGAEYQITNIVRKCHFDLVFSTHFRINAFLSMLRLLGILNCRRLVTRESAVLLDRSNWAKRLLYRIGYEAYRSQDAIVAQTEYMANSLGSVVPRRAKSRISVVPNPIDISEIRRKSRLNELELPIEKKMIVWCGRFIDVKSPLAAVKLMEALIREHRNYCLVFVGTGPLEREVKKYSESIGISEFVYFMGSLKNPYAVFHSATLGLITSRSEGFPNVLLEMLACGVRRVIATPCVDSIRGVPGVYVAPDFTVDGIYHTFNNATKDDLDLSVEIESELHKRSPRRFLDAIFSEIGEE